MDFKGFLKSMGGAMVTSSLAGGQNRCAEPKLRYGVSGY